MNTTELPVVFDLPSGVTETDTDYRVNPLIQGVLQRHNYPNGSVISPDRSLKLKFAASAVTTGTQVKGETDWRAWSRAEWPAVYGTRTPNSP